MLTRVLAVLCVALLPCLWPLYTWPVTALTLTWTDTSFNEDGFKVERRTDPGGSYLEIARTAANVPTYVDTNLILDQQYCYRVRAYNRAGDSVYSNEACNNYPSIPLSPGNSLTVQ